MHPDELRSWSALPEIDPASGRIVREPPGQGPGYWAGAPGVTVDPASGDVYLVYRLRRPRGVAPDRGGEVRIARSTDGLAFDDIWTGTKDQLRSPSIERCALVREAEDRWALFVSYVDPADDRWRIDRVEASRPDAFDLKTARHVLTADHIGAEGVKDPFVFRVAGLYHMVVSYATASQPATAEELHGTADAYNTGLIESKTGLATSVDGRRWHWEGAIFSPGPGGWDGYCARISCLWPEPPVWLALYDGSADVVENYEERCGLAYSADLRQFHRVTRDRPLWPSAPGPARALRYVDALRRPGRLDLYYELARPDGSHDLRVLRVPM